MHVAPRQAGKRQIAVVGHADIAAVEVAPETQRGDVTDADDRIESAAGQHPFVAHKQRIEPLILAQPRQRLGIHRPLRAQTKLAHAFTVLRGEAADHNQLTHQLSARQIRR